jgi:hypothetical protein
LTPRIMRFSLTHRFGLALRFAPVLAVGVVAGASPTPAEAQPYGLAPSTGPQTTAGGGTPAMTGGTYVIVGTAGQADAGVPVSGGPYTVTGGFWHAFASDGGAGPPEPTDLAIAITGTNAGNPIQGLQSMVYQLDATNAGTHDAPSVNVVITLAAGLTFDSVQPAVIGWTCDHTAGVITCTRASLAASTTESLTLIARAPVGPATLQTIATIDSLAPDPSIANNTDSETTMVIAAPPGVPTIEITTPTTSSSTRAASPLPAIAGQAAAAVGDIARVTWTNDRGGSGDAAGTTSWTLPGLVLQPGVNVVTVAATDTNGLTATDVIALTLTAYYLAEGSTGTFFDTDVAIVNPNTAAAPGTITFLTPEGTAVERTFTAPPRSRQTIAVDAIAGMEQASFATVVTSSSGAPLVVERTMRWDASGYGGHGAEATAPASQWHFAEGAQGFFSTYLLLFNPHGEANRATVRYLRQGAVPVTQTHDLAPMARLTVDAGADPALVDQSFGISVTFDRPGLAERAMYFGASPLWRAGHASAGVTQPSASWFFAEGATGPYFETFILISNPNAEAADVEVTFLPDTGVPVTLERRIPPMERLTLNIEADAPSLANVAVATQLAATRPIVAERAQYWPFTPDRWMEAHASAGVTAAGQDWGLAEGRVGGEAGYQTYILLANPGTTPAEVTITFVRESGAPVVKTFSVPATSRFNVSVGPDTLVPELSDERFGAIIHATSPIVVERALYWNAGGEVWSAGTNVTGTRLQPQP